MLKPKHPSRSALVLLGVLVASLGQAQDLATLARKEKERRAKVVKPVKVLTEEDGKEAGTKGTGSVTALTGEGPAAAPASSDSTGVSGEGQSAVWKERADRARAAVTRSEYVLTQLQNDLEAFRADIAPVMAADAQDPMRLQKRHARIFEMNKQIEAQKIAVTDAKKALVTFEDEARRAGVPAGWLR